MTAGRSSGPVRPGPPGGKRPVIDTSVAHMARVYDYWLGGKDNYAADREAAEQVMAANPNVKASVRAQRGFLGRVVHFLVTEAGIRQFLDIGTGLPSANNTHEVAQRAAPQARIVYVDNDPMVLAHARALLTSKPEGATAYVHADLRDTDTVLAEAAHTLDFGEPVAVLLIGVLQGIPDEDDPAGILARLMAATVPGSYLAVSQLASDVAADPVDEGVRRYNERAAFRVTPRGHAEVSLFFGGLELLDPGVVQLHRWRPGPQGPVPAHDLANYGGVARKP